MNFRYLYLWYDAVLLIIGPAGLYKEQEFTLHSFPDTCAQILLLQKGDDFLVCLTFSLHGVGLSLWVYLCKV